MRSTATVLARIVTGAILALAIASAVSAQTPASNWYQVGNSLVDLSLAGLAGGPVDRVWYSFDGSTLYATTSAGKTFETRDFESWKGSQVTAPPIADLSNSGTRLPEPGVRLQGFNGQRATLYAFGEFVYESQNGGASWENLTAWGSRSIIGSGGVRDLTISPRDPEEVTAATSAGVFRSMNGGKSWSGLNQGLPNLPAVRIWDLPKGDRGAIIELPGANVVEWQPGERQAWRPAESSAAVTNAGLRRATSLSAIEIAKETVYQGTAGGVISVTVGNDTIPYHVQNGGAVERFWVDPLDSRVALAVLGARPENLTAGLTAPHVLHTVGGGGWVDLTGDLPDVGVHGVAASVSGRTIYVATDVGVYYMRTDVNVLGVVGHWEPAPGLPQAPVTDVRLDAGDHQLWAAVQGFGVYSKLAPHRLGDPKVVSAADHIARAVAPGSSLSVLGAKVISAQAGNLAVTVLATTDTESQIQIPYEVTGSSLMLSFDPASGKGVSTPLTLTPASPGILVEVDGTPMLFDATTGAMLDASNPAHPRSRIQILATGLGRVTPDWPAGKAAPSYDPPKVSAPVTAYLDRTPVQVTRSVLAPGAAGTGFYLVEIELPSLVNYGPADLVIEAAGHTSNPVRVYIGR